MGSFARVAGGVTAATLIGAGIAVAAPTAAGAQPVTTVPCDTAALITAVNNANTAGSGTLRLASHCNYNLTTLGSTGLRGDNGLPIITGRITLLGGRSTVIQRTAGTFRLIEVAAGGLLRVGNVHLRNGDATTDPGGAILISRGTAVLSHVTFDGNRADNGGAVANDSGRLVLWYTLVRNNSTVGGGGGIYNDGTLISQFSRLTGNRAGTNGGGIYNELGVSSAYRTTLDNNTAVANGGGVYNAPGGTGTLRASLVTRNTAAVGGGVYEHPAPGPVTLFGSSVIGNTGSNCAPANSVPGCAG